MLNYLNSNQDYVLINDSNSITKSKQYRKTDRCTIYISFEAYVVSINIFDLYIVIYVYQVYTRCISNCTIVASLVLLPIVAAAYTRKPVLVLWWFWQNLGPALILSRQVCRAKNSANRYILPQRLP